MAMEEMLRLPEFKVVHYAGDTGRALGEISPSNLEFGMYLNDIGTISYEMNFASQLSVRSKTEARATDWVLQHDMTKLMGGEHTGVNVDTEERFIAVAGRSWLNYLDERNWPFDPSNPGANLYAEVQRDIFLVVNDILDEVLSVPNSLDFTYDFGTAGIDVNYRIEPADSENIFAKMKQLSEMRPGFDFEDTWDRQILLYTPKKANIGSYSYSQGKNLKKLSYEDTGKGADYVVGLGA